jgi:hypothetical protein
MTDALSEGQRDADQSLPRRRGPHTDYEHLSELPATTVSAAVSLAQRLGAAIIRVARPDALTLLSDGIRALA